MPATGLPPVDRAVITDAQSGRSRDMSSRMRRYSITMAFRTACFIAMLFVPGAFKWVLLTAAVFLPYIAVVFANQANTKTDAPTGFGAVPPQNLRELADTAGAPEIIVGTVANEVDDMPVADGIDRHHDVTDLQAVGRQDRESAA